MSGMDTPGGPDWWLASDGKWYPPQNQGQGPPPPGGAPQIDGGSFFSRLFDLSLRTFITPSIVKVLFILGIVFASIYAVIILVASASAGDGGIFLGIIVAPLAWLMMVVMVRVYIELAVVFFRIEENTRKE